MFKLHDLIDDRYDIVRPIGQGAMGAVYLATDLETGSDVAVKALILPPGEHKSRFYREFQMMSQLQHPHVIDVLAAGEHEGIPYLVMVYVAGGTLPEHFVGPPADAGALAARVELACQITDALSYIHRLGIIHRDLKPDNVMLEGDHSFLMDFGLAKASDSQWQMLTRVGDVLGTAAYMSPEQIQGRRLDTRSDLYALGCLLYWLFTGQAPFAGSNLPELIDAHVERQPKLPSSITPFIPAELDALIVRLLAKDLAARYQQAEDVRSALQASRRRLTAALEDVPTPKRISEHAVGARVHLQRAALIGRDDVWQVLMTALHAFPQQGQVLVLDKQSAGVGATRLLHDVAAQVANQPTLFVRHEGHGLLAAWRDALREHAARVDTVEAYLHLERYLEPLFGESRVSEPDVDKPGVNEPDVDKPDVDEPDVDEPLFGGSRFAVPRAASDADTPLNSSQVTPAPAPIPQLNTPYDDHRFLMAHTLTAPVGVVGNVSALLPPQAVPPSIAHAPTHLGQQRLFDAAAQLFLQTPSVLLVDDVDDADEASAQLLAHLLESGALDRSLVVLAGRCEALPQVLAEVLAGLLARVQGSKAVKTDSALSVDGAPPVVDPVDAPPVVDPVNDALRVDSANFAESTAPASSQQDSLTVQVLPLAPLADEAMQTWLQARLGAPLDAALERYLLRHGGGNSRFTEELLLSLLRTQQISCQQGVWLWDRQASHVPQSFQDVFRQRLTLLPLRTLVTLAAASTLGEVIDPAVLESLCRHYPPAEHARAVIAGGISTRDTLADTLVTQDMAAELASGGSLPENTSPEDNRLAPNDVSAQNQRVPQDGANEDGVIEDRTNEDGAIADGADDPLKVDVQPMVSTDMVSAAKTPHDKRLGVPNERIRAALEEDLQRLQHANLLRQTAVGYAFSHPLLQPLLHDLLEPNYKRHFHEHLAEYLSRHQRPLPEMLAWHYAEADLPYHAAAHALAAARRAERFFAHDVSENHYRYALSLLPPDSLRAFEATLALASVLERSGRWAEAEAFYHNVRTSPLRPQALHALGHLQQKRGDLLASERYLRQALRLSEDKRPLYSDLGRTLTLKGEFDAAKKVLIRSLRLAENAPELTARERAISQAHVDLAELAIHCGDKLSAQQSLERAQRCPSEHSDLHAKIHNLLGVTARMFGKLDEAAAHYRRAEALYEALADLERGLSVKLNLSNVMADAGDRATAFAADEAVRAKAKRMGDKKHEAMAAANQGEELLARGDFALAQQMLEQAAQLFDGLNYIQYANHVRLNLTLVWLRQGDIAAAKSQLSALATRMEQTSPQHRARFELVSGEYWLLQGQADVAVDMLEQATETLDVLQEVREAIEGYSLLVLACAFDSPSDVPDYLARAVELAGSLSDPLYKQQVAYLQGHFENDGQAREAAKGWLEQAGYGHFVVRVENILSAL